MKTKRILSLMILIFTIQSYSQTYVGNAPAPESDLSIWFRKPAPSWEGQILPLGNGFIGASVFGGVDREQVQMNEHSLWTGGPGEVNGYTGGNKTSSLVEELKQVQDLLAQKNYESAKTEVADLKGVRNGFGNYQNFGDMFISFTAGIVITASDEQTGEGKENVFDKNKNTKWYTGSDSKPPFWIQCEYPKQQVINGYTLTSANDSPERDPLNWTLKASNNGTNWVTLHSVNGADFPDRHQAKSYTFTNSTGYTFYRFDFENNSGNSFQLAEIAFNYPSGGPDLFEVHYYRRDLDINQATVNVQYTLNDISYKREYFCNLPDSVFVARIFSNKRGALNSKISFQSAHTASTSFQNGIITTRGTLSNKMIYESQTAVQLSGGTLSWNGDAIEVKDADTLIVYFAVGTDYVNTFPNYKGTDPHNRLVNIIANARQKGFSTLKSNHIADYQRLFNKMTLDIGQTKLSTPTDEQLSAYTGNSRSLEATYFQYGRYLLIASSRAGSLPANLQGIWNNSNWPAWAADYHTNINVQMNYWLAEMTNLSECHLPLIEYIDKLRDRGRQTASTHYGCKGWVTHHENNIFGHTGPGDYMAAFFFPEAAAWLCQHLWDHYDFTRDRRYLAQKAYPIMKEATEFWLDFLITDKDNTLVASPSFSPEHGEYTAGCSMSQQIVWDLLTNTLAAAKELNIDNRFTVDTKSKLSKLDPGLRIGSWGQLQEWKSDLDSKTDQHRHVSHLFALHPGKQISPLTTPNFTDAAKVSLTARGDGGTGWSKAWKINFWARLFDGNHAHKMLKEQLTSSTLPNLWDTHPPFQIDGNFGATSGIAEMLLQSHAGFVHVLPALPGAWPSGSVKGMIARGGFELEFSWSNGKITKCLVTSLAGSPCEIRNGNSVLKFATIAGTTYNVDFNGQVDAIALVNKTRVVNASIKNSSVNRRYTVNFSNPASERYIISIYDLSGRQILSEKVNKNEITHSFDLRLKAQVTLIFQIKDGTNHILTKKLHF